MPNNKKLNTINSAYRESIKLLKRLDTSKGFIASTESVSNYRRVFARDGVISGLAALTSDNAKLIEAFSKTLQTLKATQDKTGRIASNVPVKGNKLNYGVSYGTIVGRIDPTCWYIIGVCQYALKTGDMKFFKEFSQSLSRAFFYLRCLELNNRGLLYIPQGGDWADEYINHGYVLFDQLLYYIAMRSYLELTKDEKISKRKKLLKNLIAINYFPDETEIESKYVYNSALFSISLKKYTPPLPLPYFTSHSVHYHIDNFAIALLILSNILSREENKLMRETVFKTCQNKDFSILPAFHPVITPEDFNWHILKNNYVFKFRNKPYEYHNGGLWPLVHGFMLSSSGKEKGKLELQKFAEILERDNYLFPEFYNGKTFKPGGTNYLGFSAAAYILAYNAVINNKKPFR